MPTRSSISCAIGGSALLMFLLTGCVSPGASMTADEPALSSAPAVTADETCGQLSELEQTENDAREAYFAGELTKAEFTDALKGQVPGFARVSVEPGTDLAETLKDFVSYVETVGPDPDGAPYVRGSIEYRDVALPLVQACIDAGSDIVVTGQGG